MWVGRGESGGVMGRQEGVKGIKAVCFKSVIGCDKDKQQQDASNNINFYHLKIRVFCIYYICYEIVGVGGISKGDPDRERIGRLH